MIRMVEGRKELRKQRSKQGRKGGRKTRRKEAWKEGRKEGQKIERHDGRKEAQCANVIILTVTVNVKVISFTWTMDVICANYVITLNFWIARHTNGISATYTYEQR